jgi:hypothetical protein
MGLGDAETKLQPVMQSMKKARNPFDDDDEPPKEQEPQKETPNQGTFFNFDFMALSPQQNAE